jgi:hypothetical protein
MEYCCLDESGPAGLHDGPGPSNAGSTELLRYTSFLLYRRLL